MSDALNARAMYPGMPGDAPAQPAPAVARAAPKAPPPPPPQPETHERVNAEALYPDMPGDQPEPPKRRTVARAKAAVTAAEKLYPDMPDPDSAATDAGAVDKAAPAQGDGAEGEDGAKPEAAVEVLEILPGLEVTAPEGFEEFNGPALDAFAPIVERTNMTRDDAQKLVDLHAKAITETVESVHRENFQGHEAIRREWRAAARSDPEILKNGFERTIGEAKVVLRQFAPEDLRQELQAWGLYDHPGLIKFLGRVHHAVYKGIRRRY